MSTLLFIQASPNGEESYSISAAQSFISEYLKHNPSLNTKIINLFTKKIPAYDKCAVEGRMAFPTTLYIDRKGTPRFVETGFSGPGTGSHYQKTVEDTRHKLEWLLSGE